jgi:IMP dehydrogenase
MSKEFYAALGKTETWPYLSGVNPSSLTYDDVLLVPQISEIVTRKEIDIGTKFGPYKLRVPIITAPMDTISGTEMIRKMHEAGAIGSLPRAKEGKDKNQYLFENLRICEELSDDSIPCLYALGLQNAFEEARLYKSRGATMVLIDVAHGGMKRVAEKAAEIKNKLDMWVVAGNIATYDEAEFYKNHGVDIARVGVGPGGLCTTRIKTGSGFPQLSAIFETSQNGMYVIADGGIIYPGDVAKALGAGAKMVMIGSMFAGTEETPGEILLNGNKTVRGQASATYMHDNGVEIGEFRTAEGIETDVPMIGSVENIMYEISGGLRSALSYSGARSLKEFRKKALFTIISSSTQRENTPHILYSRESS